MLGAVSMDVSPLKGRQLLNLDSEEEGVFTVSCAGGNRTECILPVKREPFPGTVLTVTVGGLTGGHSGTEIHRGRANANVLLGRCLRAVFARTELRLGEAAGGSKDNAIPTESRAQIVVSDEAAARAARVMQGAVLYFGAAYARFLELPMWITWGLVGFCLAWGASGMGPHPLVPAQDVAKQDPGKQPGSCWSAAHLQQLLMSSQLSGRLTVLGGKNSPTGKEMFRNRAQGSSQPSPQAHSLSGIQ